MRKPTIFISYSEAHRQTLDEFERMLRETGEFEPITSRTKPEAGQQPFELVDSLVLDCDLAMVLMTPDLKAPDGKTFPSIYVAQEIENLLQLKPNSTVFLAEENTYGVDMLPKPPIRFKFGRERDVFEHLLRNLRHMTESALRPDLDDPGGTLAYLRMLCGTPLYASSMHITVSHQYVAHTGRPPHLEVTEERSFHIVNQSQEPIEWMREVALTNEKLEGFTKEEMFPALASLLIDGSRLSPEGLIVEESEHRDQTYVVRRFKYRVSVPPRSSKHIVMREQRISAVEGIWSEIIKQPTHGMTIEFIPAKEFRGGFVSLDRDLRPH